MQTPFFCLCALLLLAGGHSQSWQNSPGSQDGFDAYEGAMLPNLYSTVIWLQSTGGTELDYTGIIFNNIFSPTDSIYYATSLFDFGITNAVLTQKYLSIKNLVVNAGRTAYTLSLSFHQKTLGSNAETIYSRLGISIIIVGSSFSGEPGFAESSYLYAKNGVLRDVVYSNTQYSVAQFDFRTPTQNSPFDYIPGTEYSGKCGMIKKAGGSHRIIEVSGCAYFRFYTYITGFTLNSGSLNQIDLGALLVTSSDHDIDSLPQTPEVLGTNSIFKEDSADNSVGLWINYLSALNTNPAATSAPNYDVDYNLMRIQLSFVFVGLRSFSSHLNSFNYPVQYLFKQDDFIHYSSATAFTPDAAAPPTLFARPAGVSPLISTLITINGEVSDIHYADTAGPGFGHAFCGPNSILMRANENSLNLDLFTNTEATAVVNGNAGFQCAFFRRRKVCEGTKSILAPLAGLSGYSLVGSNFDIGISAGTTQSGLSSLEFALTQLSVGIVSKGEISTFYKRVPNAASIFRVHVDIHFATVTSTVTYGEYLKITAFGQKVFEAVFTDDSDYVNTFVGGGTAELSFIVYSTDVLKNSIKIEYQATAAYVIKQIEIAVQQYGNQLNGIQCVTTCPPVAGSLIAINFNTNPPTCTYCKESDHVEPNHVSGDCTCVRGYYYDGTAQACLICTTGITLCASCNQGNPSVCISCTENAVAVYSGVTLVSCQCKKGFFASGTKCLACPFGCAECTSLTSCTICQPSTNSDSIVTRSLPSCTCKQGFYENGQDFICPKCSERCLSCANSADECILCREASHFIKKDNTCECRTGFYELNTGSELSCAQCSSSCLTCSTSSLYCETCSPDDFRELAGRPDGSKRCDCIQSFVELYGTCIDKTCKSVDSFCQTCAFNPVTLRSECLACGANRYIENFKCVCKPGYYEVGSGSTAVCEKCKPGCDKCGVKQGKLRCFQCADRAKNCDDGSCLCPVGTVIVQALSGSFCQTCDLNCASCVGTPSHCTACVPGFVLQDNKCVCALGTYLVTTKTKCISCPDNCNVCRQNEIGRMECITCAKDYVYNGIQCTMSCPNGKYNGGSQCVDCPAQCTSCLSASICLGCKDGFFMFAGSCRKTCPSGTVALNRQCLACQSPCSTCSEEGTKCDSCVKGFLLFHGKCVTDCPAGTYFGDSSCLACNPRCLTCRGTSTNCLSCAPSQYLFEGNCYAECPAAIVNGTCTKSCPDGTFYQNSKCTKCDSKCLTCQDTASSCTVCASGFFVYGGTCLNKCPKGTFQNGQTCIKCDQSCAQCESSSIKCTSCANGYARQGNYCVQKCQNGFYKDPSSGYCKDCGEGCKICSSAYNCSECFDPKLGPINGKCTVSCPPGALHDGKKCVCTFGILHQNSCISNCPTGYFSNNKACQPCQYPCRACQGSGNICVSCIDGFTFDKEAKRCIRTNRCPYGQIEHGTGCSRACPDKFVYHKDCCIFSCPAGYDTNGYGGCVAKSTPSICEFSKFQQGSTCVQNCVAGYYPNHSSYVCQKCKTGCQLCIEQDVCIKCESGYVFESSVCSKQINCPLGSQQFKGQCYSGCPAGTYLSGQSCAPVCQQNTYFWNPFCYGTCPTKFRTQFACVNECPKDHIPQGSICKYKKSW